MKAVGAYATIRLANEIEERTVYVSFGTYNQFLESDSYGVLDEDIFYYFEGEAELKEFMKDSELNEFRVMSYVLREVV